MVDSQQLLLTKNINEEQNNLEIFQNPKMPLSQSRF